MTLKQSRYHPMTLVIPVSPKPGESLTGLLARAARENLITHSDQILGHAGIEKATLGSVATRHAPHCADLANFIGIATDELSRLFYPETSKNGSYGTEIDINGVRLPLKCREGKLRRVAPAGLCLSPHHRMQWELRFIHWCGETFQYLIDRCQACNATLGWTKYFGIHICEWCGADLRDQQVDYVPEEYRDIARTLSTFVKDADGSATFRGALHPDIRHLNEFDLLKLMLLLASSCEQRPKEIHKRLCDINRASAPSLQSWERGLERLRRWPEDLHGYLERHFRSGGPNDIYGMLSQLSALQHFISPKGGALATVLREEISRFYKDNDIVVLRPIGEKNTWYRPGWITQSDAKAKYGLTSRLINQAVRSPDIRRKRCEQGERSPTLFYEDDLRRWKDRFDKALRLREASSLIGIPQFAVWELIECDVIQILSSETNRALEPRAACVDSMSVTRLHDALLTDATAIPSGPIDLEPLREAVENCPGPIAPWSEVVKLILSGDIRVWKRQVETSSLVDELMVERGALAQTAGQLKITVPSLLETPRLIGFTCAADLLRCSFRTLNDLIKSGQISAERWRFGQMIVRRSIYEYAAKSGLPTGQATPSSPAPPPDAA